MGKQKRNQPLLHFYSNSSCLVSPNFIGQKRREKCSWGRYQSLFSLLLDFLLVTRDPLPLDEEDEAPAELFPFCFPPALTRQECGGGGSFPSSSEGDGAAQRQRVQKTKPQLSLVQAARCSDGTTLDGEVHRGQH